MIEFILNKAIATYHEHKKTFARFLLVGIGTTTSYIGLFSLLWYKLHINHIAANSIAFAIAASFQFFANRKLTFKIDDNFYIPQIAKYLTLILVNYVLSVIIIQVSVWSIDSPFVGLIITSLVTPLTGYIFFRFWIFYRQQSI